MNDKKLLISHIRSLRAQLHALKNQLGLPLVEPDGSEDPFKEPYNRFSRQVEGSQEERETFLEQFPEDREDFI